MRKVFFLKILFKIFLLVIIPITLIIYMILTGISFSGVLTIVAYFQFLLIWAQAEIALRQHALFASQFDPFFKIRSFIDNYLTVSGARTTFSLVIENTSQNPAYSVMISRVFDESHRPMRPDTWIEKFWNVSKKDLVYGDKIVWKTDDIEFIEGKTIEVSFVNKFGDFKDCQVLIRKREACLFPASLREPGILLNTFTELSLFFKLLVWEWGEKIYK